MNSDDRAQRQAQESEVLRKLRIYRAMLKTTPDPPVKWDLTLNDKRMLRSMRIDPEQ